MRAVSEALADGYAVNLTNHQRLLAELQLGTGLTDAEVARKLLVSPHTYRRWRRDRTPNPTAIPKGPQLFLDGSPPNRGYLIPSRSLPTGIPNVSSGSANPNDTFSKAATAKTMCFTRFPESRAHVRPR